MTLLPCAGPSRRCGDAIDAPLFEQYFLAELSKPEYALDVFLPLVLHTACEVSPDTPSYTIYRQTPVVSNGVVKLEESRTFDLQLYTLALYRGIAARLPAQLGQLTAFLRFLALLYCAQLALNQNPLYTMDSGEYEPNVHTQTHFLTTPRQSPTEMEGLMKGELINLDPWTAWCRVQDLSAPPGEKIKKYKIQIPNPQPLVTGSTLEERIDRIRDQSRLLIAPRQASVVEAEIRGRVALLRQQAKAAGDTVAALPGVPPAAQEEQEKKTSQRRHRTGQEP